MKWEYKVEVLDDGEHDGDDYEPHLNQMGQQGWELCGVTYGGHQLTLHWKRRLEGDGVA